MVIQKISLNVKVFGGYILRVEGNRIGIHQAASLPGGERGIIGSPVSQYRSACVQVIVISSINCAGVIDIYRIPGGAHKVVVLQLAIVGIARALKSLIESTRRCGCTGVVHRVIVVVLVGGVGIGYSIGRACTANLYKIVPDKTAGSGSSITVVDADASTPRSADAVLQHADGIVAIAKVYAIVRSVGAGGGYDVAVY